jgi:hypothetical protein
VNRRKFNGQWFYWPNFKVNTRKSSSKFTQFFTWQNVIEWAIHTGYCTPHQINQLKSQKDFFNFFGPFFAQQFGWKVSSGWTTPQVKSFGKKKTWGNTTKNKKRTHSRKRRGTTTKSKSRTRKHTRRRTRTTTRTRRNYGTRTFSFPRSTSRSFRFRYAA